MALIATAIIGFSALGTVFVFKNYGSKLGELKTKLFPKRVKKEREVTVEELKKKAPTPKDRRNEEGVLMEEFCGSTSGTVNQIKQLVRNVFFTSERYELVDVEVDSDSGYLYMDFEAKVYYRKKNEEFPNLKILFKSDDKTFQIKING